MRVFKMKESAKLPTKNDNDMCYDLYASEYAQVRHGEVARVHTGLQIALPDGHHASLRSRSGLSYNHGVQVLGGQIDQSYRGEWMVIMTLAKDGAPLNIQVGDKIAQFKIEEDKSFPVEEVSSEAQLGETKRGKKGFGSSDSKG